MSSRALNILALISSFAVAAAFFAGALSSANAFFFGLAIVTLYTGYQLALREGMPLFDTLQGLIARPAFHPRRAAYFTFVASVSLAGFVAVDAAFLAA